ncbi:MAG: exonuclease SbcCD subunit D C-terminal domain-containing protein, partial [Bacteroidota bacterium]
QEGLTQHYETLGRLAEPYSQQGVPCLAMGHMYTKGAVAAEKQDNIYVGNRENMEAEQFPSVFDYVALGHIHRAQLVGKQDHIRYSGSLLPLSFSETDDTKVVNIVEFKDDATPHIQQLAVPTFRRLKTITGNLAEVQEKLSRFAAKGQRELVPWVEVVVHAEEYEAQMDQLLRDYVEDMPLELVKIRILRPQSSLAEIALETPALEELAVEEVFRQCCQSKGALSEDHWISLRDTFRELQEWDPEIV